MQIALISDIHGNIEALDAVLADIDRRSRGAKVICAGDIVGYGPDPGECIRRLASRAVPCVMGNHDEMVLGQRDFSRCVYAGIAAARWTRQNLSAEELRYLHELPGILEVKPGIMVCHGTPDDTDVYISTEEESVLALEQMSSRSAEAKVLVCGHTHHAAVYSSDLGFRCVKAGTEISIPQNRHCLINPGAVGQSRDGGCLARYALINLEERRVRFLGLPYDHSRTLNKLHHAGLVPIVDLQKPTGAARYIEAARRRWARFRYRTNPRFI